MWVLEEQGFLKDEKRRWNQIMNATNKTKNNKRTWNNGDENVSTPEDYSSLIQFKIKETIRLTLNIKHIINKMHIIETIY